MTYEDLKKVNEEIKTTDIKGKEYAEVNQRIKAFRMLYPEGTIETEMLSNENGVCVFKANVIIPEYDETAKSNGLIVVEHSRLLGTGHAYEKENSTFINKTSYIENCETSAVGRALAMCGIGIDTSVASAEEVTNAINNQKVTEDDANNYVFTFGKYKDKSISEVYADDPKYLSWCLDKGKDERLKQMIELITDLKRTPIPSEEEQVKRLELLNDLNTLIAVTQTDLEKVLNHYNVESTSNMTTAQLEEAVMKLNKIGD